MVKYISFSELRRIVGHFFLRIKIVEQREQKIILIGYNKGKQYGLDSTFKILPKSYKPYKPMIIYALDYSLLFLL